MHRIVYNMDRAWRFHRGDVHATVENSHSHSYSTCKAGGIDGPGGRAFYDLGWREVDLPHDYLAESGFSPDNLLSHGYRDRDNAWYRKSFVLDPCLRGKQLLLCFDGTAVNAEFYFNGSLLARSFSAYTETVFDITERASFGEGEPNVLAVYINGFATEGWWYEGAGIYRHVHLFAKDSLHIAHNGIWAKPVLKEGTKNSWTVELETTVENSHYTASQTAVVHAALYDGDRMVAESVSKPAVCPFASSVPVHQRFSVSRPTRWDIRNPKLYTLRVRVERDGEIVDDDEVRIGFRTVAFSPEHGFLLNDRPVKLKGTCNHQDHAGIGVALPDSVVLWRLRRLKELGSNAYRCAHNPPSRELLDACDEMGILVMDENRRFETGEEELSYLSTMIRRDRNHPSVAFWSLFNEEPLQNSDEGRRIFNRLKSCVLHLDDSRPITGAMNGSFEGAGEDMDVVGINYNENRLDAGHIAHPDKAVFGTENGSTTQTRGCLQTDRTGAQVLADCDAERVPWSLFSIRDLWRFVTAREWLGGVFIWSGFDYRGEPTPFTWPSVSSQFGLMDTCGFRKHAYYFAQACFSERPMVHLLPHWNHKTGYIVRVMAPTNCEEVELFLNGKSLGRKQGSAYDTPEWQVPFEKGRLLARGYRGGKCVARDEVRTAGRPYAISIQTDRSRVKNDGQDTVLLNCCVVDRRGVVVPDASHHLTFTVEGDGYIRGVGNGNPNSHEPDNAAERDLFAGYCQALLTVRPGAEKVTVRAETPGLLGATIHFEIDEVQPPLCMPSTSDIMLRDFRMSEVFLERPDPLMELSDNDMNSFEPITLDDWYQDFKAGGWRIYRTAIRLPQQQGMALFFPHLRVGAFEVYLDGACLYRTEDSVADDGKSAIRVPFLGDGRPTSVLSILIRGDEQWSGIREGIRLLIR